METKRRYSKILKSSLAIYNNNIKLPRKSKKNSKQQRKLPRALMYSQTSPHQEEGKEKEDLKIIETTQEAQKITNPP